MSSEPMDETYAETDTLSDEPTPQDRAQTSTLAQDEVELFDPGIYAKITHWVPGFSTESSTS